MALTRDLPRGPVLVVAPHPDDEVIGCGGTIAAHVARGDRVRVLVVFDGALGDPDARFGEREGYVERRAREALAGGARLGVTDYRFLNLPEGHRATRLQLERGAERIAREVRELGARCVYAPTTRDAHLDHRQTARAVERALSLVDERVEAWGYEVETPVDAERLVPIDAHLARKRAALAEHATQTAYRDLLRAAERTARLRAVRLDGCEAAEAFERLRPREERRAG